MSNHCCAHQWKNSISLNSKVLTLYQYITLIYYIMITTVVYRMYHIIIFRLVYEWCIIIIFYRLELFYGLSFTFLDLVGPPPKSGKYPVRPVVRGNVKPPKHLRSSYRFGVHPHLSVGFAYLRQSLHEYVDARRFPGAARAQRHHAVAHPLRLVQLAEKKAKKYKYKKGKARERGCKTWIIWACVLVMNGAYLYEFDCPRRVVNKASSLHLLLNCFLQLRVSCFVQGYIWEQVVDQGHEQWLILVCQKRKEIHHFLIEKNDHSQLKSYITDCGKIRSNWDVIRKHGL